MWRHCVSWPCELAVCLLLEVITGLAAGDDNMIRLVAI